MARAFVHADCLVRTVRMLFIDLQPTTEYLMTSNADKSAQPLRLSSNPFPKLGAIAASPSGQDAGKELQLYNQARALIEKLASTTSFMEVKKVADYAAALERYARLAKDDQLEAWVAEIRIRAQRRFGEMSLALEKSSGCNLPNVGPKDHPGKREVLKAAGISKAAANRCEQVARVEKHVFEALVGASRARGQPITAAAVVKKAAKGAVMQRAAMPNVLHTGDLDELGRQGLKFGTIYADPPWRYDSEGSRGAASNHYATMTVEEIAAMPVGALAEENAHLHLWTTSSFLFEAKEVMEKWGFEYKGLFVWVKPGLGTGSYWRGSSEFLLLGVRGSCAFADKGLSSWGQFGRSKHSEKPQEIRSMIERASPSPRLELFGRKPAEGWLVWGNEIPRADYAANVDSFLPNGDDEGGAPTDFGGLKAA